jgi:hypothetical protein
MTDNKIASVRPSPLTSVIGIVAGIVFLVFGVILITGSNDQPVGTYASEPAGSSFMVIFLVIWVIVCIGIAAYSAKNLSSYSKRERERIPLTSEDVVEIAPGQDAPGESDFEARLRKLEALRKDDLVSEEEFQAKRKQIMDEKW